MNQCTNCNGEGGEYDQNGDWILCEECRGSGHIFDADEQEQAGQIRLF